MIYEPTNPDGALRQCEVVTDLVVTQVSVESLKKDDLEVDRINQNYAVVLTQDCDLEWDFSTRSTSGDSSKLIPSVLFCQVVTATELRGSIIPGTKYWKLLSQNKNERYHFLQKVPYANDALKKGLPELVE